MTRPDLDRQELARDLAAFAAKAMREAAILAQVATRVMDSSYPLGTVAGTLKRMTGGKGVGIMLAGKIKPLAERAHALAEGTRQSMKARHRLAHSSVEQDGVVFLSVRKPSAGANVDDGCPEGGA